MKNISVLVLGWMLLRQASGKPVVNGMKDNLSAGDVPNSTDWISFSPSWLLPSMSRIFRSDDSAEYKETQLLKRRIESLENSQKDLSQLLQLIYERPVALPYNTEAKPLEQINTAEKVSSAPETTSVPAILNRDLSEAGESTIPVNTQVKIEDDSHIETFPVEDFTSEISEDHSDITTLKSIHDQILEDAPINKKHN